MHARIQRIEFEQAEQRRDRQVRQPVEAAGVFLAHVGGFLEQRHGAEREHQQREPRGAQQDQPGYKADQRSNAGGQEEARDRLGPDAVMRQQTDGIGASAEERGMAERHDTGIAEREIEREREQDRHQQIGAEAKIIREREIEGDREDPGQGLPRRARDGG